MNEERRKRLAKAANQVRKGILEEVYSAQSGHPGGSLSIADVMTYLYQEEPVSYTHLRAHETF